MKDFIGRLYSFLRARREGAHSLALSFPSGDCELLYILYARSGPWWVRLSFIDWIKELAGRDDTPGWGLEIKWPRVKLLRATN